MPKETKYYKQYFERKFINKDPWKLWSSEYEQTKYKRQIFFIEKYCPVPKKILDIGCAEGAFTRILKNNFTKAKIIGIDISSKAICRGRKKVKDATFMRGDILKIIDKLPKNKFDIVIISETIYYLGTYISVLQMYEFLKKIRNLLKKKGWLITANIFDPSTSLETFLVKQSIIESYYTLLSGLFSLKEKRAYRDYKKEENRKLSYGIRIFQKL